MIPYNQATGNLLIEVDFCLFLKLIVFLNYLNMSLTFITDFLVLNSMHNDFSKHFLLDYGLNLFY